MVIASIAETHFWDEPVEIVLIHSLNKDSAGGYCKRAKAVSALKKEHFIKTKCLFTKQELILLLEKALYLYKKGRNKHTQRAWEWHICITAVPADDTVNSLGSFTLLLQRDRWKGVTIVKNELLE